MNIDQLNADFGITGQLRFVEGKGGLPFIEIENAKATALVSLYAGQLLSFKPINEPDDLMFLSNRAYYQEGKAIKGVSRSAGPGSVPIRRDWDAQVMASCVIALGNYWH